MPFIFKELIPVEDAQRIILDNIVPIVDSETVRVDSALWRVSAETIYSPRDIPFFDRATQDGYAVRYEDIVGAEEREPRVLKLMGYIKTGSKPKEFVRRGEAYRIDTGAPLPRGADTVVPIEYTKEEDGLVYIYKAFPMLSNIQPVGGDILRGEPLVFKGTLLTPRHIGGLVGVGVREIRVIRKPKVAIFSIGDELVGLDSRPGFGQIYDINSHTLRTLVTANYAEPLVLGIAQDDSEVVENFIRDAMEKADLIISTGGSSVGQFDVIRIAARRVGAEILFHGVMSKPGKPVLAARIGKKMYLGLPGNPTSAMISFMLYAVPAIKKLLGINVERIVRTKLTLRHREYGVKGRRLYKPVVVRGDGYISVPPASESISTLLKADAYFVIPEDTEFLEKGTNVEAVFFDGIYQQPRAVVVGVYSPEVLRLVVDRVGGAIRYIKQHSEAAVYNIGIGSADVAIVEGERSGAVYTHRRKVLLIKGDKKEENLATAYSPEKVDIGTGWNIIRSLSHQSAIYRLLAGHVSAAIVPADIAKLYEKELDKFTKEVVGEEILSVLVREGFDGWRK